MAKGKRKQTKKQRAASLKNLAKARRAARGTAHALAKKRGAGKKPLSRGGAKKAAKRRAALRHLGAGRAKAAKRAGASRRMTKPPSVPRGVRPSGRPRRAAARGRRPKGRTAKQHAAAMRNLAKARSARKSARKRHKVRAHSYHVKPKRVHVPAHMSWEARGKHRKQTPAQRRASLRNLRKARAARRHMGGVGEARKRHGGKRRAREEVRRHKGQTPAQRRASLRNLRKARAARRHGKGRAREMRGYEAREASKRRKGRGKGQTAAQYRAALKNLKKARSARKRASSRHPVKGYSYHRKPSRRHVPAHLSWESVYENPLSGIELFLGGIGGLVWFGATDFVDRLIATHDLTDRGSTDAAGHELYADVPPTTGDYAGVYNGTAITAPMNAWRWLGGAVMTAAPFGLAAVIGPEHTYWKSSFQGAGFGGLMRIGGKAIIDLVALVTMWTKMGERLYDGEMRAQIMTSSDPTPVASLPYASSPTATGVQGVPKACGACTQCKSGVGACAEVGVGWPSMPRENVPTTETTTPPAPPPPPPATTTPGPQTPGTTTQTIQGVSRAPALPERRSSPFAWGAKEEERSEAA